MRAASSEVEGSLHVHPEGPSQQQLDQAGPKPTAPTAGRLVTASQCGRPGAPGGWCLSRGSQVGRHLLRSRPPCREEAAQSSPAESLLPAAHPQPARLALAHGAAHLSELPGVPPRPRPPRAPLPRTGSRPVPRVAAGSPLRRSRGRGGRGEPRSEPAKSPELRTKPARRRCSAAPAVSAPRSAGSSRPGTGNDLSSRSLPPRGAAGAAGRVIRCDPLVSGGPRWEARETEPSPRRRLQRVSSHL